ncbi:MAG TPA: HAD family phosphatase [Caulobacteraceae bacterium]|nr:HAD family phosphatase [Caulobacteraceae bacterium]
MARFEAVIFDCDGVLVDSEALALEVELEILEGLGLTFEKQDFVRRFMGTADAHFHDLLDIESRRRLGRPLREDFIDMAHAARQRICRERLAEVPGARKAVSATRTAKAVASSSRTDFLREKLSLAHLIDLFEPHIYSTQLVPHAKPAPDIFLYAAEKLGVAPQRSLVLEDSVNGVRAGRAAGMTVWGFVGGGHCDVDLADHLIDEGAERSLTSWAEVEALLSEAAG